MDKISRDKTKAFKTTEAFIRDVDNLVKASGKTQSEFFEDLITELKLKKIEKNDQISGDLRKYFETDIQKLKTATNAILSLFSSQMENIAVEKDSWESMTTRKMLEKQTIIEDLGEQIKIEKEKNKSLEHSVNELSEVNQSVIKERDTLLKRIEDLEQLNEMLIHKEEELKSVDSIKKEKKTLEDMIQKLNQEKEALEMRYQDEIKRMTFHFEKEQYELKRELLDAFNQEKEELRNGVRKLTEQNTREFYLKEIERKEKAHKEEIHELKDQLQKLRKTIE